MWWRVCGGVCVVEGGGGVCVVEGCAKNGVAYVSTFIVPTEDRGSHLFITRFSVVMVLASTSNHISLN